MEGHRDFVMGLNERYLSVDVPFDHFGQKHPTGSCKVGQNIKKKHVFSRLELVRARTFEQKVIETWL